METIKRILKKQGRSQVWLAKEIGVSPMTLNHWLSKRRVMPLKYELLSGKAVGIPYFFIFTGDKVKEKC